jgi:hypothetical protein
MAQNKDSGDGEEEEVDGYDGDEKANAVPTQAIVRAMPSGRLVVVVATVTVSRWRRSAAAVLEFFNLQLEFVEFFDLMHPRHSYFDAG